MSYPEVFLCTALRWGPRLSPATAQPRVTAAVPGGVTAVQPRVTAAVPAHVTAVQPVSPLSSPCHRREQFSCSDPWPEQGWLWLAAGREMAASDRQTDGWPRRGVTPRGPAALTVTQGHRAWAVPSSSHRKAECDNDTNRDFKISFSYPREQNPQLRAEL